MAALPFLEARLDTRVSAGAEASVYVPGRVKRYTASGRLTQNFAASVQTMRFDVAPAVRTAAQFNAVRDAFFVVMLTPYAGLRFKNWGDYQATLSNSRATLVGESTTELQLQRLHTFGSIVYLRDIYKPVSATVYRTRSGSTAAITASVNTATGIATISGHTAGDTYAWVGEFDIPVTFSDDEWTAQIIPGGASYLGVSGSIKLEEIRL